MSAEIRSGQPGETEDLAVVNDIFQNQLLVNAALAAGAAQFIKVLTTLLIERSWRVVGRLFGTGGMPSSHSAAVAALATSAVVLHGWSSPHFALSAVFGYIVIYDALGVRREAGVHAKLLNELVEELRHVLDEGFQPEALRTLLGHTGPQVLAGVLLGVTVGLLFST